MNVDQIRGIVLDEFRYWRDAKPAEPETGNDLIAMGAIGAYSNIMAAIKGMPRPGTQADRCR